MRLFRNYAWVFPLLLLATIFQNYHDLSILMSEGSLFLFKYEGSVFYKIIKDIIYVMVFIFIIFHAIEFKRLPIDQFSALLIFCILAMVGFSIIDNGLLVGLIGLRWAFPFLLFVLMKDWVRLVDTNAAVQWLLVGLVFCLTMQIHQLFFMPPVFGEVTAGISARTPGFFVAPNSAAFFACASAASVIVFVPFRLRLHICSVMLAIAVSSLAQSGTGMLASSLLALWLLCGNRYYVFWIVALVGLALALPNLDILTGRDSYVELSGGGRIDAFLKIFDESALSFSSLGLYTNTVNLLSNNPEDGLAPDSLIASWVGNFGIFASALFLLSMLFVVYGMRTVNWSRAMPSVLVFLAFSMTTIIFEAFPMNLYLALGVWSAQRHSFTATS